MVTRVCGSVGRLNPTMHRGTNVSLKMMKIHTLQLSLPQWRTNIRCAPNSRYWPQRVRSVTPHTLNSVRDGIILADLHKSLQIWGWFLPKKIDLPTQGGGGEVGILGGQKIKTPTPGGSGGRGWGEHFKSPVNFMNCRENR